MTHLSNHPWSGQDFPPPSAASGEAPLSHLWRLRMELDLWSRPTVAPAAVAGYRVFPWRWEDCADHARVLFRSFEHSPDSEIIPSFRSLSGCVRLVNMVAHNDFFWSSATFLARQVIATPQAQPNGWAANSSVSGLSRSQRDPNGAPAAVIQIMGDIPGRVNLQNIGVSAAHRGKGLGRHLLERSIQVLRGWGISRMGLEVTESNEPALALYRSLGFEVVERLAKPFVPRAPVKVKFEPGSPHEHTVGCFGSVMVRSETGADAPDSRSHSPNPRS